MHARSHLGKKDGDRVIFMRWSSEDGFPSEGQPLRIERILIRSRSIHCSTRNCSLPSFCLETRPRGLIGCCETFRSSWSQTNGNDSFAGYEIQRADRNWRANMTKIDVQNTEFAYISSN